MFSDYTATRHSNHRKYRLWMHTTVISTYPVMMVHFLHFPSAPPFCLRMRLPPSNIQMNGAESCKVIALSKCFRSKGPEEIPLRANSKEEINEPTMVSWLFFFAVHRKRCVWRKNQHVGVFLQRKRHAQISSTSGLKPLSWAEIPAEKKQKKTENRQLVSEFCSNPKGKLIHLFFSAVPIVIALQKELMMQFLTLSTRKIEWIWFLRDRILLVWHSPSDTARVMGPWCSAPWECANVDHLHHVLNREPL